MRTCAGVCIVLTLILVAVIVAFKGCDLIPDLNIGPIQSDPFFDFQDDPIEPVENPVYSIEGKVLVPAGSLLADNNAPESTHKKLTGLVPAKDGTRVMLHMNPALTAETKDGKFSIGLPGVKAEIVSEYVVFVQDPEFGLMRAFSDPDGHATISPVSEYGYRTATLGKSPGDASATDFDFSGSETIEQAISKMMEDTSLPSVNNYGSGLYDPDAAPSPSIPDDCKKSDSSETDAEDKAAADDDWDDWEEWEDDDCDEDAFDNIMEVSDARIFAHDIKQQSGNGRTVEATIDIIDEEEEAEITAVELFYRVNGGEPVSMKMTHVERNEWTADIPGGNAGDLVEYFIKVTDSYNNVTSGSFSSPEFRVAAVPDMDNSDELADPDMDFLEFEAGYDEENLYFRYTVQSEISAGTTDPPYVHGYNVKITNPDLTPGEGLMVGRFITCVPMLKDPEYASDTMNMIITTGAREKTPQEKIDKFMESECFMNDSQLMTSAKKWIMLDAGLHSAIHGNEASFSIERKYLGKNPSGRMRVMTFDAASTNLEYLQLIPINASNFITLYTSAPSYTR